MDRPSRFLLVDDDPIFLVVGQAVVETLSADHVVVAAGSGSEGLEALSAHAVPFDFIILDLNMPGFDGLAFLRQASAVGFQGQVIISSGEAEAILRSARMMAELLGIRVLGAIKKPLTTAKLQDLLSRSVEAASVSTHARRNAPIDTLKSLELVPYYQPQHDAWSGKIEGLEALVRARSVDGQIHGPGKLFNLIRCHTELVSTTLAITREVLADMVRWQQAGMLCRTSINLDVKVAEDPEIAPALMALVQESQVDACRVCLELTETALPADMTRLVESLARLRMAGFELSLDDYGTGGSNFELLRLCPFTEIKIDGSIIRAAGTEAISRGFLDSAFALAASLDAKVVCEGVETLEQLELARSCGVHLIQGFLFSKPMPAAEVTDLLSAQPALTKPA